MTKRYFINETKYDYKFTRATDMYQYLTAVEPGTTNKLFPTYEDFLKKYDSDKAWAKRMQKRCQEYRAGMINLVGADNLCNYGVLQIARSSSGIEILSRKELVNYGRSHMAFIFPNEKCDLDRKTASKKQCHWTADLHWVVSHLFRDGFLERVGRGKYRIVKGPETMNKLQEIEMHYLSRFREAFAAGVLPTIDFS